MGLGPRQAKTPTYATGLFCGIDIRLLFAYGDLVMNLQSKPQPVLNCKGCRGAIPIGIVPTAHIIRTCPLCGERRRYLPEEVYQGHPSLGSRKKPVGRVRYL